MTKAILFYRNSLLTKLFMLVILLVGGGNSVWADDPYVNKLTFENSSMPSGWSDKSGNSNYVVYSGDYITTSGNYSRVDLTSSDKINLVSGQKIVIIAQTTQNGSTNFYGIRYQHGTSISDFSADTGTLYVGTTSFPSTNTDCTITISIESDQNQYIAFWFYGRVKIKSIDFQGAASSCTSVDAPTGLSCTAHTKSSLTFGWTAASNAETYTATLYSDSDCNTEVTSTSDIDGTSVTFSGLSGNTTYYCKVQSNGDGTTYCAEGNVTDAASGTTDSKDYTLTVVSNNDDYGTATANTYSLDKDEEAEITAVAETDYKFRSWSVTGTGAELSSTTTNPTTLTMGTADATVTATFSALEHYTITYNHGANGSGDAIASGDKTEDVDFTLSSSTYSRDNHVQTGWALTDGGEKAYELGGTYTGNADLALYPFWTEQYTITYNNNGGMGTMTATTGVGEVTLKATGFVKSGHSFLGWATSNDKADDGIVEYADQAVYTLSSNVTLYAVWGENYCMMRVATSGDAITAGDVVSVQSGAFGGTMTVESTGNNLTYGSNGIISPAGYNTTLTVTLNDYMKPGSVILLTLYNFSSAGYERGYKLVSSNGTDISTMSFTTANASQFLYTVTAEDALNGTNTFKLVKVNTNGIAIKSLTVTDCQPGGVISASGWNTYSSNKKLDLSTISGGTAYYATAASGSSVTMTTTDAVIDAGEGIMIKGTAGDSFTINTTSASATLPSGNLLVGLPNGGSVTASSNNWVFGWPTADASDYGFYYVNSTAATLGAGKAYLNTSSLDTPAGARLSIVFSDEQTTGIVDSKSGMMNSNEEFYDLQGRKVKNPAKGLYIVNGKKVFIGNKH